MSAAAVPAPQTGPEAMRRFMREHPLVTTDMFTPAERAAWAVAVRRGLALTAADLRAMVTAALEADAEDMPEPCSECGSRLAYAHGNGCSRA